jgi:hypothetical protein
MEVYNIETYTYGSMFLSLHEKKKWLCHTEVVGWGGSHRPSPTSGLDYGLQHGMLFIA